MANTKEEEEEEEEDPLKKQFQSLEEDWKSYKKTVPRDRRSHHSVVVSLELLSTSPKKLVASLQQCHSPRAKTNYKISGRSLLEELENVKDDDDDVVFNEASPICRSVCSSVLSSEENGSVSCSCLSNNGGSASSSASSDSMREEEVDRELESKSGEERWMIWLPVTVLIALLGVILMMVGFGGEEWGEYVTPT